MALRRRLDDEDGEDHSGERSIDWRTEAPRWFLVWGLLISVGVNSMLGTCVYFLVTDRIARIEQSAADPKWDLLVEHSAQLGQHNSIIRQHDDQLNGEKGIQEQLRELRAEVREVRRLVQNRRN